MDDVDAAGDWRGIPAIGAGGECVGDGDVDGERVRGVSCVSAEEGERGGNGCGDFGEDDGFAGGRVAVPVFGGLVEGYCRVDVGVGEGLRRVGDADRGRKVTQLRGS